MDDEYTERRLREVWDEPRQSTLAALIAGDADLYDIPRGAMTPEQCVIVCPQCEGEGSYADGLDEAACSTTCTRCESNGWIVDVHSFNYASARIKGDKDRENPVERPQPLETGDDLTNELVELAYQYLSDLRYPPFGDSKDRRIERIKTVLEAVEKVKML